MKIAIVMTVKNESRLLLQHIYYHIGIGVSKIYVYFDDTNDDGISLVKNIPEVEICYSVPSSKYNHLSYLKKFTEVSESHSAARQSLNTFDALKQAENDNIDWLLSIDADEFFITSSDFDRSLEEFFKPYQENGTEIIKLSVYEVVPRKMEYDKVALEENLFKTKKNFSSRLDQIYFKIYDPYHEKYYKSSFWSSHTLGKCALKVGCDLMPKNTHRFKHIEPNQKAKLVNDGHILHFFQYDFSDFMKKSRNYKGRSLYYVSGKKIGKLKELYINLVNDPKKTEKDIENFYSENLLFTPKKLKRLKQTKFFNILPRKEAAIIEINKPREILQEKKHLL